MGCHGNHEISKTQITFIFEDNIFLHLSGPIGRIYAHNKMSDVFNSGLINPVAYYNNNNNNNNNRLYFKRVTHLVTN